MTAATSENAPTGEYKSPAEALLYSAFLCGSKVIFALLAAGRMPIFRQGLEWGSGRDSAIRVTDSGVIHIAADRTDIFAGRRLDGNVFRRDTGLFFFRGEPGARFAVCNAGGAFAFVGAMQSGSGSSSFELLRKKVSAASAAMRL